MTTVKWGTPLERFGLNTEVAVPKVEKKDYSEMLGTLKNSLGSLEKENQKLQADLEEKQKARVKRVGEHKILQDKMISQIGDLDKTIDSYRRHALEYKKALREAKLLYNRQVLLFKDLMTRIKAMESSVEADTVTPDGLRIELTKMLSEIRTMRDKREALQQKIERIL